MRWPRVDGPGDSVWASWFFNRSREPGRPPYNEYGPDAEKERHQDRRPWPEPVQRDLWLDALVPAKPIKEKK